MSGVLCSSHGGTPWVGGLRGRFIVMAAGDGPRSSVMGVLCATVAHPRRAAWNGCIMQNKTDHDATKAARECLATVEFLYMRLRPIRVDDAQDFLDGFFERTDAMSETVQVFDALPPEAVERINAESLRRRVEPVECFGQPYPSAHAAVRGLCGRLLVYRVLEVPVPEHADRATQKRAAVEYMKRCLFETVLGGNVPNDLRRLRVEIDREHAWAVEAITTKPEKPITARVAATKYKVSGRTLRRMVQRGELTDYRAAGHARNAPMILDDTVLFTLLTRF